MTAVSLAYKTCTFAGKYVFILESEGLRKFFIPFFKHLCSTWQKDVIIYVT
jgi:hypothetical protein